MDLTFRGMAIIVASVNGAANTIIDCQQHGGGFTFTCGETSDSIVDGFTITNGLEQQGGAIYCEQASPTILHCVIVDSEATGTGSFDGGGGIRCGGTFGGISIEGCTITRNKASGDGGGIYAVMETGAFRMERSIVWENCASRQGQEFRLLGFSISVTLCDIRDGPGEFGVVDQGRMYSQNIDADPRFVDAEGGDYRLLPGSPCIGLPLMGTLDAVAGAATTSYATGRSTVWAEFKQNWATMSSGE